MSIISILNRNHRGADAVVAADQPEKSPSPSHPPLMLLSADAAGPSTRRLHIFADAASAADYIDFWFPAAQRSDVLAFWALPDDPAAAEIKCGAESTRATVDSAPPTETQDQVIVMARHPQHEDSVYPFSFPDVPAANHFVRQEMKRGLDLRSVGIYWAAFAKIDTLSNGAAAITPPAPPTPGPVAVADAAPAPAIRPAPQPDPTPDPTPDPAPEPERTPTPDPIATYNPPAEPTILNDVIRELALVLNVGRPDGSADAFQGFGSPPGRF